MARRSSGRLKAALIAATALSALAAPAHAEWLKAESAHFVVYADESEADLRSYVRKVERFDALMTLFYPVAGQGERPKLHIYIADGIDELRQIAPGLGSGVGGFYSADDGRVFAVVDRTRSDGDHTLFHEYTHHFMFYTASAAYPGWFIEGFAEYYATAEVEPNRARIGLPNEGRLYALAQSNGWVPMEDVLRSRTSGLVAGQMPGYYAQSWALTHYMFADPQRTRQLGAYLGQVARGVDPITALTGTIDRTPAQLQDDVRRHLNGMRYNTLAQPFPDAEVTVTRLPRSARDLIWLDLRLDDDIRQEDRAAVRDEVRRVAARHPGDRLAALCLARAEMLNDDPAAAQAILAPFAGDDSTDADALRFMARALMQQADDLDDEAAADALYGQARTLLARAYRQDPMDYRIIYAIAENRRHGPGYPNDNDLDTLAVAVELAPQVMDVRYAAAQAFMARRRYAEAIAYLNPVANNPHGGERLQPARDLLAEAHRLLAEQTAGA